MAGIRVEGVSKSYRMEDGSEREVLNDIDLTIGDGEFVCLLGPSGCGKTTLLNILSGLEKDFSGTVSFTEEESRSIFCANSNRTSSVASDSPRVSRDASSEHRPLLGRQPAFSYMFQESRLLPWLTVRENLRFVLDERDRDVRDVLIDDWLARVRLSGLADYFPSQLSVGMQQRVSLVRALIVGPTVLFMDEPLSSLDELTASQMRDELLALWGEQHPTVVFVTHNPLEAVYLADRVLIMSPGPGTLIREVVITDQLPRPRDSEDARLWELSRECVRTLKGEERATAALE